MNKNIETVETIIGELLIGIPNFIETDFVNNEDGTYTISANFEHPAHFIGEEYAEIEFLFAKIIVNENLKILSSSIERTYKED